MNKSPESNRADNATYKSRAKDAYAYMKALYLKERGLTKFPRKKRAPDYSDFDKWLDQKLKEN